MNTPTVTTIQAADAILKKVYVNHHGNAESYGHFRAKLDVHAKWCTTSFDEWALYLEQQWHFKFIDMKDPATRGALQFVHMQGVYADIRLAQPGQRRKSVARDKKIETLADVIEEEMD